MNTASLGFGALVCPGREIEPSLPVIVHEPYRCQNCGAYVNQHCTIAPRTGFWSCTFCNKSNESNGEYRAPRVEDLRNWPELATSVVNYVDSGSVLIHNTTLPIGYYLFQKMLEATFTRF